MGAGTPCPTTAQLTPATGGACLSTADNQGNFGFWALPPASFSYFLIVPPTAGGGTYGPYPFTANSSDSGVHPIANTNLVYDCDSECTTSGTGLALPSYVYTLSTGVVTNISHPGDTCTQLAALWAAEGAPLYNPAKTKNVVYMWCGTNDLAAGSTAAQTLTNMQTLAGLIRATGFKVIVSTIQDRGSLDWTTTTNVLNGLIRGAASSWDGISDIAGVNIGGTYIPTVLGCNGCSANVAYFNTNSGPDAIHNSAFAKENVIAPIASVQISLLFGVMAIPPPATYQTFWVSSVEMRCLPIAFAGDVPALVDKIGPPRRTWTAPSWTVTTFTWDWY